LQGNRLLLGRRRFDNDMRLAGLLMTCAIGTLAWGCQAGTVQSVSSGVLRMKSSLAIC